MNKADLINKVHEVLDTTKVEAEKVERLENISPTNQLAGSPIETKYCIHFMKKGEVIVHFYETRVWEDNPPKKTLKRIRFTVK